MEEVSQNTNPNLNSNPSPIRNPLSSSIPVWPTIDGPLGLSEEDSLSYARRFYKFGFALLPLLWAVNCFYFWPVLRHAHSFPRIRRCAFLSAVFTFWIFFSGPIDVVGSAIGFTIFTALLCSWALTFAIGGERFFGPVWDQLVMYNLADRLALTGWS